MEWFDAFYLPHLQQDMSRNLGPDKYFRMINEAHERVVSEAHMRGENEQKEVKRSTVSSF